MRSASISIPWMYMSKLFILAISHFLLLCFHNPWPSDQWLGKEKVEEANDDFEIKDVVVVRVAGLPSVCG
jgi:hypothetical protein